MSSGDCVLSLASSALASPRGAICLLATASPPALRANLPLSLPLSEGFCCAICCEETGSGTFSKRLYSVCVGAVANGCDFVVLAKALLSFGTGPLASWLPSWWAELLRAP